MMANKNLINAKKAKDDEFYTQLSDIEKELKHFRSHFKNKIVFCNCDNPIYSNFWRYFHLNFGLLKLKKLITTHYSKEIPSYKMEYSGGNDSDCNIGIKTPLIENGDFRSLECVELLKQSDIIVTNPPFSLFREYVAQLVEHNKKFIIIGNINATTYKGIFPLIKNNRLWLGYNHIEQFIRKDKTLKKSGNVVWYTNCSIPKQQEQLHLIERYIPEKYPKYESYDAIEVSKVANIPQDYDGVMGVPITFLKKYNSEQFELVGEANNGSDNSFDLFKPTINGELKFKRILIRNKKPIGAMTSGSKMCLRHEPHLKTTIIQNQSFV